MNNLAPPKQIIHGKEVFLWKGYYWQEIKQLKHDCGRVLVVYRKFRLRKGELKEISQGGKYCPNCYVSLGKEYYA